MILFALNIVCLEDRDRIQTAVCLIQALILLLASPKKKVPLELK